MILPKNMKLSRLPSPWSYLKVSVVSPSPLDITDIEFKSAILQSLQVHHGKVGSLSHVDVLKITPPSRCSNGLWSCHVILRVSSRQKEEVWSAVTLISTLQGTRCAVNTVKESPILASLLSQNSPTPGHHRYRHQPPVF
eukprot:sb/3474354/